jgi:LCP family protein required for cell wall assembly
MPWYYKFLIIFGSLLIVVSGGGLAAFYLLGAHYNDIVGHAPIVPSDIRPTEPPPPQGPLNYLILGSDTRSAAATSSLDTTGDRSDTIMLVHINKGLKSAFIVSIPRDSYVDVVAVPGKWKGGKTKINAAFSYGGATAAARTVYNLTKVPLDGAVVVNFNGVENMVDAVGGVHVCPLFDTPNWFPDFKQYGPDRINGYPGWKKGKCYDMTGVEALVFSRQRERVKSGDFGRMKNQQLVIKAIADKATSAGMLVTPWKFNALVSAAANSLTIDQSMNLTSLAYSLKGIGPNDLTFATAPYDHAGSLTPGGESFVFLDQKADESLWQAIRDDKTAEWLAVHPQPDEPSWNPDNDPVVTTTVTP